MTVSCERVKTGVFVSCQMQKEEKTSLQITLLLSSINKMKVMEWFMKKRWVAFPSNCLGLKPTKGNRDISEEVMPKKKSAHTTFSSLD